MAVRQLSALERAGIQQTRLGAGGGTVGGGGGSGGGGLSGTAATSAGYLLTSFMSSFLGSGSQPDGAGDALGLRGSAADAADDGAAPVAAAAPASSWGTGTRPPFSASVPLPTRS